MSNRRINRLSVLLTLAAVLFFTGAAWVLGEDGRFGRQDGLILIGLFVFWQCFQTYDVLKHNVRRRASFGALFYVDVGVVLVCAYGLYASIDWLVAWLSQQQGGFVNASHLGWLSGWLMALPNALLAFYWGWKHRADIVYSSQIGGRSYLHPARPWNLRAFQAHGSAWIFHDGPPDPVRRDGRPRDLPARVRRVARWSGWIFIAGYAWFLYLGLA